MSIIDAFNQAVQTLVGLLYGYGLVYLLIAVGLFLTIYLGAPQFRYFGAVLKSILGSRSGAEGGISSFQAFAIGVATRVGIGNIGGVALALIVGGPGAIFWMWVVALVGMATALAESTLAQIFKVRAGDGTFRGGPAYYLTAGLGWRVPAIIFAIFTIVASGMSVPMVQINTVAKTFEANHGLSVWVTALIVMALLAPVIIGGVRWVARVSEVLTPIMALLYILVTVLVLISGLVTNPGLVVSALESIFTEAFGLHAAAGGVLGAIFAALINGARRGLFSNEAGLGTSPNAAGAATVAHPVQQGLIQSLGVFIDTIVVCTCTAVMILIINPTLPTDADAAGSLTSQTVATALGEWMLLPMSIIIFIFGYSSAFGAYSYGQIALDYLSRNRVLSLVYRVTVVVVCGVGAIMPLEAVWALSDLLLGLGAIINLVGLVLLAPWVRGALRDWRAQRDQGIASPRFVAARNPHLPKDLAGDIWV